MLLRIKNHIHETSDIHFFKHVIYYHIRSNQVTFCGGGLLGTFDVLLIPKKFGGRLCRRHSTGKHKYATAEFMRLE